MASLPEVEVVVVDYGFEDYLKIFDNLIGGCYDIFKLKHIVEKQGFIVSLEGIRRILDFYKVTVKVERRTGKKLYCIKERRHG